MRYFKEANLIWKTQVPSQGQSTTVEGELIRAVEKLRYEAQDNGNINWDEGFELFCQYISNTLNDSKTFDEATLNQIKLDIKRLRHYKDPYLEDDLYDRLTDCIVEWSHAHSGPVKREIDPEQYR